LHLATSEGLLSGKIGDDLADLLKKRFASVDLTKRYIDSGVNNVESACRCLSFGLAMLKKDIAEMVNTILCVCKDDSCTNNKIAACIAAFFVRCAINKIDTTAWKHEVLTSLLPLIKTLLPDEDKKSIDITIALWNKFGEARKLGEKGPATFQDDWIECEVRNKFYSELFGDLIEKNRANCAVIIAYDALLFAEAKGNPKTIWGLLLSQCVFGNITSYIMAISAFCFGAIHQFEGVPDKHTRKLEQTSNLSRIASKLFDQINS